MQASLIAHTQNAEQVVAQAARVCYSPVGAQELGQSEAEKLIQKLLRMGHESPLEHASFTFSVSGISRACSHQLVRHRIASYSQRSQRYVREDGFEFVTPPTITKQKHWFYLEAMNKLEQCYQHMINNGIPEEDARYLLPNACKTDIVVTMNARSLRHFFRLRMCERAQWEIRELANRMLIEVKSVAPMLFQDAGPGCVSGECPEGEYSCQQKGV